MLTKKNFSLTLIVKKIEFYVYAKETFEKRKYA